MYRSDRAIRRRSLAIGAMFAAALAITLATPMWSFAATAAAKRTPPARRSHAGVPVNVSVDPHAVLGAAVPEDFLGLSFELSSVPDIAGYADSGDLVDLMRSLGPGVMRFGGISADTEVAWLQEGSAPTWAHLTIGPQQLAGIASLARATGWQVLLTVNFGHDEPAAAAQEARAAQSLLGSSLAGIAIGNEPDRYVADGLRSSPWSFADYLAEAGAYRAAIAAAAPGVQIVGPDASSGGLSFPWVTETAAAEHPALLAEHFYPLTKCQAYVPTLGALLSPLTRANESALLARLSSIAHASAIPLRLDETNNVSCRGQPGVSDVFASALWAVDYVARAMASGVVGVNLHDLIGEPATYSPLVALDPQELASGALHANPEWYALLLARSLLGDEPVHAAVAGGQRTLTAGAFVSPSGSVHVVLVNFVPTGTRPALVRLRMPPQFHAGTILRLTAPGLRARTGVTLGGRPVSAQGAWSPATALPRVSSSRGALELSMPASSAALVTLYPVK
jgi:hypothetical protein